MATDFVCLHFFKSIEFEELSTQSVASYKQGYGNNELACTYSMAVECGTEMLVPCSAGQ